MEINKNIALCGFRDKRHIVYSMLKLLSNIGRTVFITTNPCYIQLSKEFVSEFEIDDISFYVLCEGLESASDYIDLEGYDFYIWDCLVETPNNIDMAIIVDHSELYREAFKELEKKPANIYIVKGEQAKKDEISISLIKASVVEDTLTQIETELIWFPIPNNAHNKTLANVLSKAIGISQGKLLENLRKGRKK